MVPMATSAGVLRIRPVRRLRNAAAHSAMMIHGATSISEGHYPIVASSSGQPIKDMTSQRRALRGSGAAPVSVISASIHPTRKNGSHESRNVKERVDVLPTWI